MRPVQRLLASLLVAAGALAPVPAAVQAQDLSKALNKLQSFVTPNHGQPAKGSGHGDDLGNLAQLLSQSLDNIDERREIAIGRQLAAVLLGSKPLHPNAALQHYVNQLGRWISLQSARPNLPWTFAVIDDLGFNAFAAPGGYVFVTSGLLDHVPEEAELAGILAHEITHVTGRHHLKAMRKTSRAGLLTQALASQFKGDPVGSALSTQLLSMGREMYARGLDQDDEFEADRVAVALAARAGFDPYGLVAVLQRLRSAKAGSPVFALSLSTHPPTQQRLDQLERAMGNRLDGLAGLATVPVAQRVAPAAKR